MDPRALIVRTPGSETEVRDNLQGLFWVEIGHDRPGLTHSILMIRRLFRSLLMKG